MTDPDDPDPDAAAIRAGLLIRHIKPPPETPRAPKTPDEVFREHCQAIKEFLGWGAQSGSISEFGYCVLNAMRAALEELEGGQRIDDLMRADLLRFSETSAWFFDPSDVYDGTHPLVLAAMPAAAALVAAIDDQRSARPVISARADWTIKDGRTNSADEFLALGKFVGRIIRDSAHALLSGQVDHVGHLVMAQLAHVKGLAPRASATAAPSVTDSQSREALVLARDALGSSSENFRSAVQDALAAMLGESAAVDTETVDGKIAQQRLDSLLGQIVPGSTGGPGKERALRLCHGQSTWIIAKDPRRGYSLHDGLGALGVGRMWRPTTSRDESTAEYVDAPVLDSTGGFGAERDLDLSSKT